MSWTTPKTNWMIQPKVNGLYNGDWFNIDPDYLRIKGNLEHLADMSRGLGYLLTLEPMPAQLSSGYPRAGLFNSIEQNVVNIAEAGAVPYSGRATWEDNGRTPLASDLNRLEQFCATAYTAFITEAGRRTKLSFRLAQKLGGSDF